MPLNVSREEILTSYEHEVLNLRRLGREWNISEGEIDQIIQQSFNMLQEQYKRVYERKSVQHTFMIQRPYTFIIALAFAFKLIVLLLLLIIAISLLLTYHKPTYNLVVRNVQELIYPAMKCLRWMALPIVRNFPSLTVWYDEMCLIENPYFRANDVDCWACEEVRSVLDLSQMSNPRDVQPHSGFPYVVKGVTAAVSFSDLHQMYTANKQVLDKDAYRISTSVSSWHTLADVMAQGLDKKPTPARDAHVVWRVNRLTPARILRGLFPRPQFVPNTVNVERFVVVDEPNSPQHKLPFPEGYRVFVLQSSGERLVVLEPVDSCSINCTRVSVLLKPSDFLYYNSWFYRPKSSPIENSTSISISYIGSF